MKTKQVTSSILLQQSAKDYSLTINTVAGEDNDLVIPLVAWPAPETNIDTTWRAPVDETLELYETTTYINILMT